MTDTGSVDQTSIQNSEQPQEPTFSQSHVDAIAGRARQEGAEKARREFESRQAPGIGHMPAALTEEQIRQIVDERSKEKVKEMLEVEAKQYQAQQMKSHSEQIAADFHRKMMIATEKDPEFGKVFERVNFGRYGLIVAAANSGEHTAEIMHDLFKNKHKLGHMLSLGANDPDMLFEAVNEMRDSIAKNATAKTYKEAPEPLRQVKSSNARMDNVPLEDMTVDQLRKSNLFKA